MTSGRYLGRSPEIRLAVFSRLSYSFVRECLLIYEN